MLRRRIIVVCHQSPWNTLDDRAVATLERKIGENQQHRMGRVALSPSRVWSVFIQDDAARRASPSRLSAAAGLVWWGRPLEVVWRPFLPSLRVSWAVRGTRQAGGTSTAGGRRSASEAMSRRGHSKVDPPNRAEPSRA